MQEPQTEEDAAERRITEQEDDLPQEVAIAPKAYAFDGWGMVPLELDPV